MKLWNFIEVISLMILLILAGCSDNESPLPPESMGAVSGTIRSDFDKQPLAGTKVECTRTNVSTMTDTKGRYLLTDIPVGLQTFVITHPGCQQFTGQVEIIKQKVTTWDVTLQETDDIRSIRSIVKLFDSAMLTADFPLLLTLISPNYKDNRDDWDSLYERIEGWFESSIYLNYQTTLKNIKVTDDTAIVSSSRDMVYIDKIAQPALKVTMKMSPTILLEKNPRGIWLITNLNQTPQHGVVATSPSISFGQFFYVTALTRDNHRSSNVSSGTIVDWNNQAIPMDLIKTNDGNQVLQRGLTPPRQSGIYDITVALEAIDGSSYQIIHQFDTNFQ